MPERVLVRHQLDEPLATVGVEAEDVLAGHRARLRPYFTVVLVGEGVLRIQLEVVDLPPGEQIDEIEERLQGGDLAPADVEHHAPERKIRRILDLTCRERSLALAQHLDQGHDAVERPCRITGHEVYAVVSDPQPVALRRETPFCGKRYRHPAPGTLDPETFG